MTAISCSWSRKARPTPLSEPTREPAATESGGDVTSSSSTARRLALSSGRMDSFSSKAKVFTDATLLPSRLGGFAELLDDESCVALSSCASSLGSGIAERGLSASSSFKSGWGEARLPEAAAIAHCPVRSSVSGRVFESLLLSTLGCACGTLSLEAERVAPGDCVGGCNDVSTALGLEDEVSVVVCGLYEDATTCHH